MCACLSVRTCPTADSLEVDGSGELRDECPQSEVVEGAEVDPAAGQPGGRRLPRPPRRHEQRAQPVRLPQRVCDQPTSQPISEQGILSLESATSKPIRGQETLSLESATNQSLSRKPCLCTRADV